MSWSSRLARLARELDPGLDRLGAGVHRQHAALAAELAQLGAERPRAGRCGMLGWSASAGRAAQWPRARPAGGDARSSAPSTRQRVEVAAALDVVDPDAFAVRARRAAAGNCGRRDGAPPRWPPRSPRCAPSCAASVARGHPASAAGTPVADGCQYRGIAHAGPASNAESALLIVSRKEDGWSTRWWGAGSGAAGGFVVASGAHVSIAPSVCPGRG